MANNANINKVIYGNDTLIDLTEDDVTANDVLSGKSFHLRSGASAVGALDLDNYVLWSDTSNSVKKNLLPLPYYDGWKKTTNGVTFTVNADGTISLSGTSNNENGSSFYLWGDAVPPWLENNTDYILSGCPSGGASSTYMIQYNNWGEGASVAYYDTGDGVTIQKITDSTVQKLRIWIRNGVNTTGMVFKPMIRKASVGDDTYVQYMPDNTEVMTYEANGILGAKNLCPTFSDITRYGVTFTVDSEGCIHVSGTATQQTEVPLTYTLKKGTYIVSGAPSGSSSGSYDIYIQAGSPYTTIARSYDGSKVDVFTLDADTSIRVNCRVPSGAMDTTKVFKPMIRLVSDTDDTYVPYAMTNRELTGEVMNKPFTSIGASLEVENGALQLPGNRVYSLERYVVTGTATELGQLGVRANYVTKYGVTGSAETVIEYRMQQTANSLTYTFTNAQGIVDGRIIEVCSSLKENYTDISTDVNAHTCTVTFKEAKTRTVTLIIK